MVQALGEANNRNWVQPECKYDPLSGLAFVPTKADEKKGLHVSRETPFPFSSYVCDQSLNRPRTPTRLPPPRFSLPKLRGWPGRALLPRSP